MSALLVSKLSKEDFNIIGLSDRQKIMELRIKCSTFRCKQPERELKSDRKGALKFKIPKAILEDLLDDGFKVFEIATLMVVSERTIYRRLKEYNIQVREFSEVSDDLLDENLKNLCEQFPNCGERFLNEMSRQEKGIVIQRSRVRESFYRIDADDVLKGEERMGYTEEFIMLMAQIIFGIWICLLYTSPSPRDGLLSRMPSSA